MGTLRKVALWVGLRIAAAVGYRSVRVARRDGAAPSAGSGNYHERYDRVPSILQSREYFRDNAIYRGIVQRFAGYIVGPGFGLQARTADAVWNAEAERIWKRFWRRPEVRGTLSGRGLQKMVVQEMLLAGDVAILKTDRGLLKVVEAEQIAGPLHQDDGIERDDAGAATGYYVAPYTKGGGPDVARAVKIPADAALFMVNPERPTSSRGMPPSQSAFGLLKRINDVCDSEAQAWQLLSRMAVSITRKEGPLAAFEESTPDTSKDAQAGDVAPRVQIFDDVVIFNGEPGDEIKGVERNVPGQNFTESLTTFLRLMGLPFGLPLEFVMLDWTKSNYSQCRAILEQVGVTLGEWQDLLVEFFLSPVYEWVISRAIESGELRMSDEWEAHDWIYPSFPWIDQEKEAKAHGLQVDRGFTTHASVVKAKGLDREELLIQIDREVRGAIAMAKKIEQETGVKVPFEWFCGRQPAPVAPPAAAESSEEAPAESEEPEKEPVKKEPRG